MATTIEKQYVVGHFGGFPLRISWFPRLVDRYRRVGFVPSNLEDVACDLGLGKNMVKSLRAWGRTAGILSAKGELTDLAKLLFLQYDPFLERGESVALLHFLISSNFRQLSACTWVFNFLLDDHFLMNDAIEGFKQYLDCDNRSYSHGTLRGDVEPVLRMHTPHDNIADSDIGDRFFAQLGLIHTDRKKSQALYCRTWVNERLFVSDRVVEFSLLRTLAMRRAGSSALSSLYVANDSRLSPGSIFGLTQDGFYASVERICKQSASHLELTVMPGDDALVVARGKVGAACMNGDIYVIDSLFLAE